jgi:hypothetical protein
MISCPYEGSHMSLRGELGSRTVKHVKRTKLLRQIGGNPPSRQHKLHCCMKARCDRQSQRDFAPMGSVRAPRYLM